MIILFYRNVYLWLPSLFFMVLLIVNGIFLLYNSINGNYVSVAGVCENIEFTGIRKQRQENHPEVRGKLAEDLRQAQD